MKRLFFMVLAAAALLSLSAVVRKCHRMCIEHCDKAGAQDCGCC